MAKITFRAETRIPRQIILPLLVATTAQVPRVLTLDNRKMEVHEAIAGHLEQRYPKWVEAQAQEPSQLEQSELEKLTIADLVELAAKEGIDLGKAKKHAEIVKVIADHKPLAKMTIAELTKLAEDEGIDLGKAKLHAEIVQVIADHQAADEDGEPASDDEAADEQDSDADDDQPADEDADEGDTKDSDA